MTLTLAEVARDRVGGRIIGDPATLVAGVRHDSRAVEKGDLFVAIAGGNADGRRFAEDAVARGASSVCTEQELALAVPQLVVDDARRALAYASAAVYEHPTFGLDVVGVTGTNGKSTVTALVYEALSELLPKRVALLGTVRWLGPGIDRPSDFTTPEADDFARFAKEVRDAGATHLVMEVSSHGLAQKRVEAVRFHVAAFTNLTQDHLDFHGTMEAYFEAKARLFDELGPSVSVVNVDDTYGAALFGRIRGTKISVSAKAGSNADVRVLKKRSTREGLVATVATPKGTVELRSPLFGEHNVENLVVTLGIGVALDVNIEPFAAALANAKGARGRLERVAHPDDVAVFVDYAHTPDALARVLAALRPATPGRLFVVFGCGGDRDRTKRAPMGRAAREGADVLIATSDNPRTEDALAILREVAEGIGPMNASEIDLRRVERAAIVEADRKRAIARAIEAAMPGDTVLIAGKGHEDYQILGTTKVFFDDVVEARRAIEAQVGGGR
jgi:UDP-N-acetylmuramoyl-L-alanyl-D-glutamate--2,6-diaminopimelate ligase